MSNKYLPRVYVNFNVRLKTYSDPREFPSCSIYSNEGSEYLSIDEHLAILMESEQNRQKQVREVVADAYEDAANRLLECIGKGYSFYSLISFFKEKATNIQKGGNNDSSS